MAKNIFPYELPENWHWSTLGNVARIFTGNSINEKIKHEKYFGKMDGLTYIATKDVGFDNRINYDTNIKIPESENFKVAPKCTTLLCIEGGSAGKKIGFTNQPVCFVNKLCAFVSDDIYSKLIYLFMQTEIFLNQFNTKKHGLIGGVSIKNLAEILIPLPPLDEQKKIVEIIESLFEKLDAAKSIVQKILDGYELRRAAILHKAFTGELTKNFRADSGLTLDDWQEKKLGDISESQYGYTAKSLRNELLPKLLRITDIQNGFVDWKNVPNCQIEKSQLKKYLLKNNDIVIARTGATTGKSFILKNPVNAVFASYLIRLKILETVEPCYCYYFLQSKFYWDQIFDLSSGIAQPGVNAKKLQTIKLPIPPIDEQKEIVRVLDSLLEKEQRTKEIAEKILSEIDLLKRTILARAFRGELGTNNPSENINSLAVIK